MNADWTLCLAFLEKHPRDAAIILEKFSPYHTAELLQRLPEQKMAANVLEYIATGIGAKCLGVWPAERIAGLLTALPVQRVAMFLRYMDGELRNRILEHASAETAETIPILLHYQEDTAGALMDPHVFTLAADLPVADARKRIKRFMKDKQYYLYVVDREHRLAGILNYRNLLLAAKEDLLSDTMVRSVARLPARAGLDTILAHPDWSRFPVLPVVDEGGVLLGVLRYDSLRKSVQTRMASEGPGPVSTALRIGEIYWLSILGLLGSMANVLKPRSK